MTTRYDRTALLRTYLEANQPHYLHDDFKVYYQGLLVVLERAFGLSLSHDGVQNQPARPLWMLFDATVRLYHRLGTPMSSFLEASLLYTRLEEAEVPGQSILALVIAIEQTTETSRRQHLQLLDELFVLLWGPLDCVVTSDDLRQIGFDDTKEPKISDYWEYC